MACGEQGHQIKHGPCMLGTPTACVARFIPSRTRFSLLATIPPPRNPPPPLGSFLGRQGEACVERFEGGAKLVRIKKNARIPRQVSSVVRSTSGSGARSEAGDGGITLGGGDGRVVCRGGDAGTTAVSRRRLAARWACVASSGLGVARARIARAIAYGGGGEGATCSDTATQRHDIRACSKQSQHSRSTVAALSQHSRSTATAQGRHSIRFLMKKNSEKREARSCAREEREGREGS